MKTASAARAAAFDVLLRVERQDAFASELLHSSRLDALSPADRALATELTLGVLRWRSHLDHVMARASSQPLARLDAEVLIALRLGVYQLAFLDRVPERAAVHESVELVKRAGRSFSAPFVNAVLRKLSANPGTLHPPGTPASPDARALAAAFAHPLWLVERWVQEFGVENAKRICEYGQHVPAASVRVADAAVEGELREEGVVLAPGRIMASARRVAAGDVTRTRAFAEGRVHLQDEASQLVAALVGQGSRILDCCAAPGGKTGALAAGNPEAQVLAVELHPHRARTLRRLVRALNVRVIAADARALPITQEFDRVLADVPCSGTGTLARHPEIKWRLAAEDLEDLHRRQVAILRAALDRVARGGRLVYSTCSLEKEENQAVVEEALSSGLRLVDCREELGRLQQDGALAWQDIDSLTRGGFLRTLPGVHPCEGFFAAMVERE
ncbi:MAG: 16S rRNA (cytosine(967)-C(5))-methyltransferase RsmB [Acidobacteria bacterium]|nr:16S rRNA (cytosine(967)-C(5))-methyltransferase RsmB [Acidobacteriota bacterium]